MKMHQYFFLCLAVCTLAHAEPIMIGTSECDGWELQLADDICIKQAKVAYQKTGLSCGYHAALNAVACCKSVHEKTNNLRSALFDDQQIAACCACWQNEMGPNGIMRKHIVEKRLVSKVEQQVKQAVSASRIQIIEEPPAYLNTNAAKIQSIYHNAFMQLAQKITNEFVDNHAYAVSCAAIEQEVLSGLSRFGDIDQNIRNYMADAAILHTYFDVEAFCTALGGQQRIEVSQFIRSEDGENLFGDEVDIVLSFLTCENRLNAYDFTVIQDPHLLDGSIPELEPANAKIKDKIAQSLHMPGEYVHGFALGSMQQTSDTHGSNGHWIAVVLHKTADNKRHYYIFDSINSDCTHADRVKRLINAIEKTAFPEHAPLSWSAPSPPLPINPLLAQMASLIGEASNFWKSLSIKVRCALGIACAIEGYLLYKIYEAYCASCAQEEQNDEEEEIA